MSMLTPSPGDLSVKLLNAVIGPGWQNLFRGVSGAHLTLLGQMFGTFNVVVLAGLVAMFGAVLTSGVISTAHSGEVLGKRYHSAWVPIRAVGSVGLLAPLPMAKGLCMLQALVLMFVSYGIGMADHLWSPAVQYLATQGGALEGPRPTAAWSAADTTLRALILRDYWIQRGLTPGFSAPLPTWVFHPGQGAQSCLPSEVGTICAPAGMTAGAWTLTFPSPGDATFDDFGTISVPCAGAQSDSLCFAKASAMGQLVGQLNTVADAITSNYLGGRQLQPAPPAQIADWLAQYQTAVEAAVPAYLRQTQGALTAHMRAFATQAQDEGWASAGMWYESVAASNDLIHRAVAAAPTATAVPWRRVHQDMIGEESRLPGYLAWGERLMRAANPGIARQYDERLSRATAAAGGQEHLGTIERAFNRHVSGPVVGYIEGSLEHPTGDPLARLQAAGNQIDDAVGALWLGTAAAKLIPFVKVRMPTNLHYAALMLLGAGADLANYLPALPFVLWILALIGWVVLVLESLVAAPLWAAAHGLPEGEGFAGTAGRQGYMMFLGVLLRPALMTFGYFIAVGVFDGAAWLIGQGWRVYSAGEGAGYVLGPVNAAATVTILVVLLTLAAHQAFGLITWLPAHVTRWIGQMGDTLGGGEQEVRSGVRGTGGGVAEAARHAHPTGGGKAPRETGEGSPQPPAGDRGPGGDGAGAGAGK